MTPGESGFRFRVRRVARERALRIVPERRREAAGRVVVEELLLPGIDAGGELRRRVEPFDEQPQRVVESAAQGMTPIGAQFGEEPLDRAQHALEDLLIDRGRYPPGSFLLDARANRLAVLIDDARRELDDLVEHFLMPIVLRHHGQHLSQHRREVHRAHALGETAIDDGLHVLVTQHVRRRADGRRGAPRDRARVLGVGEPLGQTAAHVERAEPVFDHVARQEVALHERAERAPHAILLGGDDRRVRNRNAERMAEQRGDGEPVGQAADHSGLHRRTNDPQPRVPNLENARDDEQHRRGDEQQRGAPLHRVELRLARRLVGQDLHGAWLSGRLDDGGHRGVTFTLEKSTRFVLVPAGTSTYSTTG